MIAVINVILYDTGDTRGENNEPLGIEVIGARLLKECASQIVLKLRWYNQDGMLSLEGEEAGLLGVSLNIKRLEVLDAVCRQARALSRPPLIFVGNVGATYGYPALLRRHPDIVCMLGEGEEIYPELVRQLSAGTLELERIPNLAYLKDGELVETRRQTADLTRYVKPLRAFTEFLLRRRGIARMEASRGCAWNRCSFCCVGFKYNNSLWRPIPLETVLEQIEELAQAGIRSVYFTDEDFVGGDPRRLERLINMISQRREENPLVRAVNYYISLRPWDILDGKTFDLLRQFTRAGLREVFVGIESGCNAQLRRYGKCTTAEINQQVLDRAGSLDAAVDIGFILFDPEMTVEDLLENMDFIQRCRLWEYGASLIKRLRIQSFTALENRYSAREGLEFDLNELEYRYHFQDSRIETIYGLYEAFNSSLNAYQIQNEYRGEIEAESSRQLYQKELAGLRSVQFEALKRIVQSVLAGEDLCLDDLLPQGAP